MRGRIGRNVIHVPSMFIKENRIQISKTYVESKEDIFGISSYKHAWKLSMRNKPSRIISTQAEAREFIRKEYVASLSK